MNVIRTHRSKILLAVSLILVLILAVFVYVDIFLREPGKSLLIPKRFVEEFRETPIPKPRAYFRIEFPEKEYRIFQSDCNISFEYPVYSEVVSLKEHPCWFDVSTPEYGAKIHLTYHPIDNLQRLEENEYEFISKQIASGEANDVESTVIQDTEKRIYGLIYDLVGNTATSLTFFVSDSTSSLRGSLYFYVTPNYDSLAPAIDFFRKDVVHLINTISWK
ncbi:MAG: hypothetical protein JW801_05110 [Bacteroidales bacterium]|nr:hypothetical protein [Bacteroidales bacterium]